MAAIQLIIDPETAASLSLPSPNQALTMLPSGTELYYTLAFTDTAAVLTPVETVMSGGTTATVSLPLGVWALTVEGYLSQEDAEAGPPISPVVSGSASPITISSETDPGPVVKVTLSADMLATGILDYTVNYPSSPQVSKARLTVTNTQTNAEVTIDLLQNSGGNSSTSTKATGRVGLSSGYYRVQAYVHNGKNAVNSDIAHIYDSLETAAVFTFNAGNFAAPPDTDTLDAAITGAEAAKTGILISEDGAGIPVGKYWVTRNAMDTFDEAVVAVQSAAETAIAQTEVAAAETILTAALLVFNGLKTEGTYNWNTDTDLGLYIGTNTSPESNTNTLADSLVWLQSNAASDTDYTIILGNDESLDPWTLEGTSAGTKVAADNKTGVSVTLKGKGTERTIGLTQPGSLLTVSTGITLILDNHITLKGRLPNTAALLQVISGDKLVIKDGARIIDNVNNSGSGGGVYVSGTDSVFEMLGGEISGNISSGSGGGVYFVGSTLSMSGSAVISGNTSSSSGGGVYFTGSTLSMSGSAVISRNFSSSSGGGVYAGGSNASFTMNDNAAISDNTSSASFSSSSSSGGGVYFAGSTFIMSGSAVISGNTSSSSSSYYSYSYSDFGGGVYITGNNASFTMNDNTKISDNTSSSSSSSGGGVYFAGSTFSMSGSAVISGNTSSAASSSGGVYFAGNTFSMSGSAVISGNTASVVASTSASAVGGGVYVRSNASFTMNDNATISDNSSSSSSSSSSFSSSGGGVYIAGSNASFTMNDSTTILDNSASASAYYSVYSYSGGGIYFAGSTTFTMSGGAVSGNTSSSSSSSSSSSYSYSYSGGGIYFAGSTFTMSGGAVSGNTSSSSSSYSYSGGGIYFAGSTFTMSGGAVSGNTGGGVYVGSGAFTMGGSATISGNTSYSSGGGVYVRSGTFIKQQSGGTIYGANAGGTLKNTASGGDSYGHAVYVSGSKKRNLTAGAGVMLDSRLDGSAGGWE
jgi:hypothetical protein